MILLLITSALVSSIIVWTFEVKLQRWPMMIFGAPFTIKEGNSLNDIKLCTRLLRKYTMKLIMAGN